MDELTLQVASALVSCAVAVACAYNVAATLPMRGRRTFLWVMASCALFAQLLSPRWQALRQLHLVLFGFALPFFLLQGSIGQRLVTIALNVGLLFMGEFVSISTFTLATGTLPFETLTGKRAELMLALQILFLVLVITGGKALRGFLERRLHGAHLDAALPHFALSTLLNIGLSMGFFYLLIVTGLSANQVVCVAGMLLSLLALPIDAALMAGLERARRSCAADARAAVAQERLDACLAEYGRVTRSAVRAARLRHDARNHLRAVAALAGAGETARAARYAREMAREIGRDAPASEKPISPPPRIDIDENSTRKDGVPSC